MKIYFFLAGGFHFTAPAREEQQQLFFECCCSIKHTISTQKKPVPDVYKQIAPNLQKTVIGLPDKNFFQTTIYQDFLSQTRTTHLFNRNLNQNNSPNQKTTLNF